MDDDFKMPSVMEYPQEAKEPEQAYERVASPFEYFLSMMCEALRRQGGTMDMYVDEHNFHANSKIEVYRSADSQWLRFKVIKPTAFDKAVPYAESAAGAQNMGLEDILKWGPLGGRGES